MAVAAAGTYPYLLAAGFVAVDGWLAARPGRVRNLMLATALTTATALPIVLPVLPAADVGWTSTVKHVATLTNPAGIRNQEWHGHIYLCTGSKSPWAQLWPRMRHYS